MFVLKNQVITDPVSGKPLVLPLERTNSTVTIDPKHIGRYEAPRGPLGHFGDRSIPASGPLLAAQFEPDLDLVRVLT